MMLNTITARALHNNTPGKAIVTPLIGCFKSIISLNLLPFALEGGALASQ